MENPHVLEIDIQKRQNLTKDFILNRCEMYTVRRYVHKSAFYTIPETFNLILY